MRFILTLVLGAFSAATALAVPTLLIDDLSTAGLDVSISGASPVVYSHNIATSAPGVLTNWAQIAATGTVQGNSQNFVQRLNSIAVTALTDGKLVIAWVNEFGGTPYEAPIITTSVSPVQNDGTIEFSVEADTTGAVGVPAGPLTFAPGSIFGIPGVLTSGLTSGVPDPYADSVAAPLSAYSLAMVALIDAKAGDSFQFDWRVQGVPEPGFYGVLSLALSGLFFFGYRRRNATGEMNG